MKILRCCFIVFTFFIARLKMVKCCSNATTYEQISIGNSFESSTSPSHDEVPNFLFFSKYKLNILPCNKKS